MDAATRKLKNNKAPKMDFIRIEMIKKCRYGIFHISKPSYCQDLAYGNKFQRNVN
jgi:hypothetical protein